MPPRNTDPAVPTFVKQIENETQTRARTRLGLKATDALPADIEKLIRDNSKAAALDILKGSITRDTANIRRQFEQAGVFDRFISQAHLANVGLAQIAGSQDVNDILKKRAELLAAKVAALEAVHFSREEAMQILLGDIAARA